MNIGELHIDKLYIGELQVDKVYLGETLVYGGGATYKQVIPHFTNEQYFETNIDNCAMVKTETIFTIDSGKISSSGTFLFGSRDSSASKAYCPMIYPNDFRINAGNNTLKTTPNSTVYADTWYKHTTYNTSYNDRYNNVYVSKSRLTVAENGDIINGEYVTEAEYLSYRTNVNTGFFDKSAIPFNNGANWAIGRVKRDNVLDDVRPFYGKIANIKVWVNKTAIETDDKTSTDIPSDLLANFIFVLKDGQVWAYDKVGKQFYEQHIIEGGQPLTYEEYGDITI